MASTSPASEPPGTVFRTYSQGSFLEWDTWNRLQRILKGDGGCYGLIGPRGVGKSWLMQRALDEARGSSTSGGLWGLGLWFPTPSKYDAVDFLSALGDNFAYEVATAIREDSPVRRFSESRATIRFLLLAIVSSLIASIVLSSVGPLNFGIWGGSWLLLALFIVAAGAAALAMAIGVVRVLQSIGPRGRLSREATRMRERVAFSSSLRSGDELSGGFSKFVSGGFKMTSEKSLTERPLTLSSLVYQFRRLAEATARELMGPVVIAIDELDKVFDPEEVRQLLRDVKGIFEVPGVTFLVSVSFEAARDLELGGLSEQNVFNSSFYSVIEMPPLRVWQARELLESRDAEIQPAAATALGVLSGGNPRELVRMADAVVAKSYAKRTDDPETATAGAVSATIRSEAITLARDIAARPRGDEPTLGREDRDWLPMMLTGGALSPSSFEADAAKLGSAVTPQSAGWMEHVQGLWRILILRMTVGGILIRNARSGMHEGAWDRLREVVALVHQSLPAAQRALEEWP